MDRDSQDSIVKRHAFGINADTHNCACWLDEGTLVYPVGKSVVLHNTATNSQRFLDAGITSAAITAMAVSANSKFIAIAEGPRSEDGAAQVQIIDTVSRKRRKILTITRADVAATDSSSSSKKNRWSNDSYNYNAEGGVRIVAMAFSNDGRHLLTQCNGPAWRLFFWNWERTKPLASIAISALETHQTSHTAADTEQPHTSAYSNNSDENSYSATQQAQNAPHGAAFAAMDKNSSHSTVDSSLNLSRAVVREVSVCPADPLLFAVCGVGLMRFIRFVQGEMQPQPSCGYLTESSEIFSTHTWLTPTRLLAATTRATLLIIDNTRFVGTVRLIAAGNANANHHSSSSIISDGSKNSNYFTRAADSISMVTSLVPTRTGFLAGTQLGHVLMYMRDDQQSENGGFRWRHTLRVPHMDAQERGSTNEDEENDEEDTENDLGSDEEGGAENPKSVGSTNRARQRRLGTQGDKKGMTAKRGSHKGSNAMSKHRRKSSTGSAGGIKSDDDKDDKDNVVEDANANASRTKLQSSHTKVPRIKLELRHIASSDDRTAAQFVIAATHKSSSSSTSTAAKEEATDVVCEELEGMSHRPEHAAPAGGIANAFSATPPTAIKSGALTKQAGSTNSLVNEAGRASTSSDTTAASAVACLALDQVEEQLVVVTMRGKLVAINLPAALATLTGRQESKSRRASSGSRQKWSATQSRQTHPVSTLTAQASNAHGGYNRGNNNSTSDDSDDEASEGMLLTEHERRRQQESAEEDTSSNLFWPLCQSFHTGAIHGLSCAVRRPLLISTSSDGSARVWNTQTRRLESCTRFTANNNSSNNSYNDATTTTTTKAHNDVGVPHAVALHPSGLLAVLCFTETVQMMHVLYESLRVRAVLRLRHASVVHFARGGHLCAVAHGNVVDVISSTTAATIATLRGHPQRIRDISWCSTSPYPTDDTLITAGWDGLVLCWNAPHMQRGAEFADRRFRYVAVTAHDATVWVGAQPTAAARARAAAANACDNNYNTIGYSGNSNNHGNDDGREQDVESNSHLHNPASLPQSLLRRIDRRTGDVEDIAIGSLNPIDSISNNLYQSGGNDKHATRTSNSEMMLMPHALAMSHGGSHTLLFGGTNAGAVYSRHGAHPTSRLHVAHSTSVTSVCVCDAYAMLVTGDESGNIILWDMSAMSNSSNMSTGQSNAISSTMSKLNASNDNNSSTSYGLRTHAPPVCDEILVTAASVAATQRRVRQLKLTLNKLSAACEAAARRQAHDSDTLIRDTRARHTRTAAAAAEQHHQLVSAAHSAQRAAEAARSAHDLSTRDKLGALVSQRQQRVAQLRADFSVLERRHAERLKQHERELEELSQNQKDELQRCRASRSDALAKAREANSRAADAVRATARRGEVMRAQIEAEGAQLLLCEQQREAAARAAGDAAHAAARAQLARLRAELARNDQVKDIRNEESSLLHAAYASRQQVKHARETIALRWQSQVAAARQSVLQTTQQSAIAENSGRQKQKRVAVLRHDVAQLAQRLAPAAQRHTLVRQAVANAGNELTVSHRRQGELSSEFNDAKNTWSTQVELGQHKRRVGVMGRRRAEEWEKVVVGALKDVLQDSGGLRRAVVALHRKVMQCHNQKSTNTNSSAIHSKDSTSRGNVQENDDAQIDTNNGTRKNAVGDSTTKASKHTNSGDGDIRRSVELRQQLNYLAASAVAGRRQLRRDARQHANAAAGMMSDNLALIREIHELRRCGAGAIATNSSSNNNNDIATSRLSAHASRNSITTSAVAAGLTAVTSPKVDSAKQLPRRRSAAAGEETTESLVARQRVELTAMRSYVAALESLLRDARRTGEAGGGGSRGFLPPLVQLAHDVESTQ